MNPRRVVVEDRVLSLADELESEAPAMAARLREVVPSTFGNVDMHEPEMRDALDDTARWSSAAAAQVARILAALDDLPAHIGRRGHVWIGHASDEEGRDDGYSAYWEDDDWLEQSPWRLGRDEVLAWARARSDDVRWGNDPEDGDELAVLLRQLARRTD